MAMNKTPVLENNSLLRIFFKSEKNVCHMLCAIKCIFLTFLIQHSLNVIMYIVPKEYVHVSPTESIYIVPTEYPCTSYLLNICTQYLLNICTQYLLNICKQYPPYENGESDRDGIHSVSWTSYETKMYQ